MLVGGCKLFFPPLPRARNRRIKTRPKQNRLPGHFRHSRLPSRSWGPAQAAWPGETHSAPICGFALDTARFGYQNPYPRAADGPGESGRTKLRKWNTYRYRAPARFYHRTSINPVYLYCNVVWGCRFSVESDAASSAEVISSDTLTSHATTCSLHA
jgi:hypothetical protein